MFGNTELIVAESDVGGKFVIIETNQPGYVCIVLMNSVASLHGLIKGDHEHERTAYSTRLVPFITQRIANYAAKHPGDKPNDLYKVIKHFKQ